MAYVLKVNGDLIGNISRFTEMVNYSTATEITERTFSVTFESSATEENLLDIAERMVGPQTITISIENPYGVEIFTTNRYNLLRDCQSTFTVENQRTETIFTWTNIQVSES